MYDSPFTIFGETVMKLKTILIGAAGGISLAAAFPMMKAAADKLEKDNLQAECNKDWGPSTQYIRGHAVKCNMDPKPNF